MLYNRVWHQLNNPKEPTLGAPTLSIHDYNIQSSTSKGKGKSLPSMEDDIDELLQRAIDQSIRESPLALNAILPPRAALVLDTPSSRMLQTATKTVEFTTVAPTKEERVEKAFGKAMKKYPSQQPPSGGGGLPGRGGPPGGGGPAGSGGSPGGGFPGGGGPLAGAAPAAPALAPVANPDVRPIGSPPSIFHGDRALADNFLDELKLYFQVNWAVPNYQSMITRATFALMYIKGEEVAG